MVKSTQAFRTIREVADWLGVAAHVLRFWESKFPQIKPVKRAGGRRYYRPADMALVGGIKVLLHDEGMTIRGVQKLIRKDGIDAVTAKAPPMDTMSPAEHDQAEDAADNADRAAWLRDAETEAEVESKAVEDAAGTAPAPMPAPDPAPVPDQAPLPLGGMDSDEEEPGATTDRPREDTTPEPAPEAQHPPPQDEVAPIAEPASGAIPADLPAHALGRLAALSHSPMDLPPDLRSRLRTARAPLADLRERMRIAHGS